METKFAGRLRVDVDEHGYFLQGHIANGREIDVCEKVKEVDAKKILKSVLPTVAPIIEFMIDKSMLMRVLANWHGDDKNVSIQVYGTESPVVIRGNEEFAVITPMAGTISKIDVLDEAGLL